MNNITIPYLEMGSGFLLGLAIGYTLKKSFKLLLLLSGLGFIFLFILESSNILSINTQELHQSITSVTGHIQSFIGYITTQAEKYSISGTGSAVVGLVTGMKIA